jgi:peptidoglycan/xylan/chitin deacetylase (PgdA/CDA1 family)
MLTIQKHKYGALYSAILILGLIFAMIRPALSADAQSASAVIFVYQRIGDDAIPQSSISLEQFREHIKELKTGGYTVLPLPKIIEAVKDGDKLPPKTVGITFEGAYTTTLNNAVPLLDEAELPFTVFFSSDMADGTSPTHMTWKQLKDLKKDKFASFGILPSAYMHMVGQTDAANAAIINKAIMKYKEQFEEDPQFFAYPYGEYSAALKKQLAGYPFKAAFGQQSGVVHAKADFQALPRFTMTENFGDLERFQLTASALPLPVTDVIPDDTVIKTNPPVIGFTVAPEITNLSKLSCFVSNVGKAPLTRVGGGRIEIRLKDPLDDRRTRVNCTIPDGLAAPGQPQQWRWFGMLLIDQDFDEDAGTNPSAPPQDQTDKGTDQGDTGDE